MNNFSWQAIRPLNGSQANGFEELCAQFARVECPDGAKFDRKGSPDAGVECFSTLTDGGEWGWQAKYFNTLGSSQWSQLDESVKTALNKHPALVRYYVCIPLDRADARLLGQQSAMDRWNEHVNKWQTWAQGQDMDVEFVWWGSSELIERLSHSDHIGRLFFWFGQRGFDQAWFSQHLDEAVKAAGPRYTPEVHVELPIVQDMERFSRSNFLFDEVKSHAPGIRRGHQGLISSIKWLNEPIQGPYIHSLLTSTGEILSILSQLEPAPIGQLPFADISDAAEKAIESASQVSRQIWARERQNDVENGGARASLPYHQDHLRISLNHVQGIQSGLRELLEACRYADSLANRQSLLLRGAGGTGKTHLLCDWAKKRVQAGLPTVLLLGQWFLSDDDPWEQLLRQLDMPGATAEQFVGALEAAAQVSDCRALVIVDALNEGNGRKIWPAHLLSFLTRLQTSPWIGAMFSVRSSYEDVVVPENIKDSATIMTHRGFGGKEYDASQKFFEYFGIEFPSVPILQPEFSNPLFLKTLCKGLQDTGETRIPRGFHGITGVFDLYLDSVNASLAKSLNYNPRDNLVRQALEGLSEVLVDSDRRWVARTVAEEVVNRFLPNRRFSDSLYCGLVLESVLVQDEGRGSNNAAEEMVFISYERFADHLIADLILKSWREKWRNRDAAEPGIAGLWQRLVLFVRSSARIGRSEPNPAVGGLLEFIRTRNTYVRQGLLEALCVQVPERTGQELTNLAPKVLDLSGIGDAFLESIVWRKLDACGKDTSTVLNEMIQNDKLWSDPLDTFVTVSTIPGHYFNAKFLNERLRNIAMPDRDSWWSVYLHNTYETEGPVDRLVGWASAISANDQVDDSVVNLAATTLAWIFTTSNRFLRDRATKALVSLLTGRHRLAMRLIEGFADVDDPYVTERIYAVAYGVSMRTHEPETIGELASLVYDRVFANGNPAVHVLLRDYARGVIERAIHFGVAGQLDEQLIRPPYKSNFPSIPCEDCVQELFPYWGKTSWNGGDLEWSRNRIRWSVLEDDFARHVIGNDSLSRWLNLRLDEEPWLSPEERRQALILDLSESERLALEEFVAAKALVPPMANMRPIELVDESGNVVETLRLPTIQVDEAVVEQARMQVDIKYEQMMAELTEEHRDEWEAIKGDEEDRVARWGPCLDKRMFQRYILWRVFDLGWTTERFGSFDRFTIGHSGRSAAKPERIGKKYQWIAYHEVLAHTADYFQYREMYSGENVQRRYEGPWQELLRDIDPSCMLRSTPGGTSWGPHSTSWWGKELYGAWQESHDHKDWIVDDEDLPSIEQLLEVVKPDDGTSWLNVNSSFVWRQPYPSDQGPYDQNRREMWIGITAYFLPAKEAEAFMTWAKSVDFWGGWMPEPHSVSSLSTIFLGEYGWAPAFNYECLDGLDPETWLKPISREGKECPAPIQPVSSRYLSESGGFDCSVEDDYVLCLPHQHFLSHLGLQWSCSGADFLDPTGRLAAFDPTAYEDGPTSLLLRKDLLLQYLHDKRLTLCWTILGEKWVVGGDASEKYHGRLKMSGAYRQMGNDQVGFLNSVPDIPNNSADEPDAGQQDEVSDISSQGS